MFHVHCNAGALNRSSYRAAATVATFWARGLMIVLGSGAAKHGAEERRAAGCPRLQRAGSQAGAGTCLSHRGVLCRV